MVTKMVNGVQLLFGSLKRAMNFFFYSLIKKRRVLSGLFPFSKCMNDSFISENKLGCGFNFDFTLILTSNLFFYLLVVLFL